MKIVVLDISSTSVDTINVDEQFIEKYYDGNVLNFSVKLIFSPSAI